MARRQQHGFPLTRRHTLALGLGAAGAMTGCAPRLAPPGPGGVAGPRLDGDGGAFVASDGARLPLTRWHRADDPAAIVIALHGFNDHAGAFREVGPV